MLEKALEEIKEFIKDKELVNLRTDRSKDIEQTLISKGMSMKVLFEYAFRASATDHNTRIPCVCLKDGTVSYILKLSLINGRFECNGCRVVMYSEKCRMKNREYLWHDTGNGTTSTYITTRCTVCDMVDRVSSGNLCAGKVTCGNCVTNKYISACEDNDYEYLSTVIGRTGQTRVIARCKHDGYIRSIAQSKLCEGKVRCRVCQVAKYEKLLSKKNCKYLRHYGTSTYDTRIVYSTPSGEEYDVLLGSVLTSRFPVSRDNPWYQQHSVYAIEAKDEYGTYIKLGTANVPEARHKGLKILCESNVKTLATFPDRFGADKLETYLHNLFKEYRLDRSVVSHIIGNEEAYKNKHGEIVMVKDGWTEWFSCSIAETLYSLDFSKIEV